MSTPSEHDSMRDAYAALKTEELLERLRDEADDFTAAARGLMRQELQRRGLSEQDIAARVRADATSAHHADSPLAMVAVFQSRMLAQQTVDVLQQQGIHAALDDRASLNQELPAPDVEGSHRVQVPAEQEEEARRILESFAPAADVSAGNEVDDEVDDDED